MSWARWPRSRCGTECHTRLAELALEHRSTLVFVNTRRMVERLAFALGERLGEENVAAHHGSLSRKLRHEAERRLKAGEIRILVATASLELGIDIGTVDLVCQINTPRAIATAMQRVGRAGHWRGAIPKGTIFCDDTRRPDGEGGADSRDAQRRARPAGDSGEACGCADAADRRGVRGGAVGRAAAV